VQKTLSGMVLLGLATLALAACGGGGKKTETTGEADKGKAEPALTKEVQEVCNGSPLTTTPNLPPSFPQIEAEKLTYTKQSKEGPTDVIEGYFNGSVTDAHEEFEKELKASGYTILFNELEAPHDSEISWKGEGRTGQVAMRAECEDKSKTYIHITNRPT
jgi:hypothetical protein